MLRRRFLWLPKTIDGRCRWLERANWIEVYFDFWIEQRWVNDSVALQIHEAAAAV